MVMVVMCSLWSFAFVCALFVRPYDGSYEMYVILVDAECVTPVSMKVIAGRECGLAPKKTGVALLFEFEFELAGLQPCRLGLKGSAGTRWFQPSRWFQPTEKAVYYTPPRYSNRSVILIACFVLFYFQFVVFLE
jgi:hypothetical protein